MEPKIIQFKAEAWFSLEVGVDNQEKRYGKKRNDNKPNGAKRKEDADEHNDRSNFEKFAAEGVGFLPNFFTRQSPRGANADGPIGLGMGNEITGHEKQNRQAGEHKLAEIKNVTAVPG